MLGVELWQPPCNQEGGLRVKKNMRRIAETKYACFFVVAGPGGATPLRASWWDKLPTLGWLFCEVLSHADLGQPACSRSQRLGLTEEDGTHHFLRL